MTFTDEQGAEKVAVTPDESGWIATAVKPGPTYLSSINCPNPDPGKEVALKTRDYAFDVPGNGKFVYFGSIRVEIMTNATKVDGEKAAQAVMSMGSQLGGVLGAFGGIMAGAALKEGGYNYGATVTVKDRHEDATAELESRYQGEYSSQIVTSLAGLTPKAIAERKAAVEALEARTKQIDEAWAAWSTTHAETACADAFKKLEGDAECSGAKCQEPLTLLEGYKKNCKPDPSAKVAVHRLSLRWSKQVGNR